MLPIRHIRGSDPAKTAQNQRVGGMPKPGQPSPKPHPSIVPAGAGYRVDRTVALRRPLAAVVLVIYVMLFGGFLGWILLGWFWQDACPRAPVEIFVGITYGCERFLPSPEGVVRSIGSVL